MIRSFCSADQLRRRSTVEIISDDMCLTVLKHVNKDSMIHLIPPRSARRQCHSPERTLTLFNEVATEYGFLVHEMEVMPDYVHLFVAADPTRSVAEILNRFKGATSRFLRQEFAPLRSRLPTLWSRSYFAATVGAVTEAAVRRYIEKGQ